MPTRSTIRVTIPPAVEGDSSGVYDCRRHDLLIVPRTGFRKISIQGGRIVPNQAVAEIWIQPKGGLDEGDQYATGASGTVATPNAEATNDQPLLLALMNLTPETSVTFLLDAMAWRGAE